MDLYIHSAIRLHGIELNYLSTGTALLLPVFYNRDFSVTGSVCVFRWWGGNISSNGSVRKANLNLCYTREVNALCSSYWYSQFEGVNQARGTIPTCIEFLSALNKREDVAIVCIPHNRASIGAAIVTIVWGCDTCVGRRQLRSVGEIEDGAYCLRGWHAIQFSGYILTFQRNRCLQGTWAEYCGVFAKSKNCGGRGVFSTDCFCMDMKLNSWT
jgi:hypothetical protein